MTKEETALAILRLLLKKTNKNTLHIAMQELIRISYINPHFTEALFRAKNMATDHDAVQKLQY